MPSAFVRSKPPTSICVTALRRDVDAEQVSGAQLVDHEIAAVRRGHDPVGVEAGVVDERRAGEVEPLLERRRAVARERDAPEERVDRVGRERRPVAAGTRSRSEPSSACPCRASRSACRSSRCRSRSCRSRSCRRRRARGRVARRGRRSVRPHRPAEKTVAVGSFDVAAEDGSAADRADEVVAVAPVVAHALREERVARQDEGLRDVRCPCEWPPVRAWPTPTATTATATAIAPTRTIRVIFMLHLLRCG